MRMLRQAAAVEPDFAPALDRLETQRLEGLTRFAQHLFRSTSCFAQHLEDEGALRDDVSVENARDILWTVNSLAVYVSYTSRRSRRLHQKTFRSGD